MGKKHCHNDGAEPYSRRLSFEDVISIGENRDSSAIGALVDLLKDSDDSHIREAVIDALLSIGGEGVARAVVPLLYEDDVSLNNIAVEILIKLGIVSLKAVLSLLGEKDVDILKFAIDIIGVVGCAEVGSRIAPLLRHPNPNIRAGAAIALGKTKAIESLPQLLELFDKEEDEWVRFAVIEALGRIGGDETVIPRLIDTVKDRNVLGIAAIQALSYLVTPDRYREVMDVLRKPDILRFISTDSLTRFVDRFRCSMDCEGKDLFLSEFLSRLRNGREEDDIHALKGIRALCDSRAIKPLIEFSRSIQKDDKEKWVLLKDTIVSIADPDTLVDQIEEFQFPPSVLIEAVAEMADTENLHLLHMLLKTVERDEKKAIIKALERIGSPSSFRPLVFALHDDDGHVREYAARALARVGGRRAISVLKKALLREPYRNVQEVMGGILSSFKEKGLEDFFIGLMKMESLSLRIVGIRGLGEMGGKRAIRHLVECLGRDDPESRREAIHAIGRAGDKESIAQVVRCVNDPDRGVRLAALQVIGDQDGFDETIVDALSDGDIWVRSLAVRLIGERGIKEAEKALIELLKIDKPPVKVACIKTLGRFNTVDSRDAIGAFVDHSDPILRETARAILGIEER